MTQSRNAVPLWLNEIGGVGVPLERVAGKDWSTLSPAEEADESTLQEFLARCPHVLPLAAFGNVFAPAACIGREARVATGAIDVVFLSQGGRLIIGETKLHKNPESRREVVAQVLEYAAEVCSWSFRDVEQRAHNFATERYPKEPWQGLAAFVRKHSCMDASDGERGLDEQEFEAEVVRGLRRGEILCLVIGDQLQDRAVDLLEFTRDHLQLALELGVVELAFYRQQNTKTESPRISRRLHLLRGWSNGKAEDVFCRSS